MAKERESNAKEDDELNVDEVAEGTDSEVQSAQAAPASPVANLFKNRIVKILSYALIAILLIIVSVVISSFVVDSKTGKNQQMAKQDQRWEEKKPEPTAMFEMGEFKPNTADRDEIHFLRVNVHLAYKIEKKEGGKLQGELNERKIQITAIIEEVLMSKTKEELDEPGERDLVREEMMGRINSILIEGEILGVYFTGFTVM